MTLSVTGTTGTVLGWEDDIASPADGGRHPVTGASGSSSVVVR